MFLFVWVFGYICVFEVLSCVLWLYNSEFVGSELGSWKRYYIRIFVFFFFFWTHIRIFVGFGFRAFKKYHISCICEAVQHQMTHILTL